MKKGYMRKRMEIRREDSTGGGAVLFLLKTLDIVRC